MAQKQEWNDPFSPPPLPKPMKQPAIRRDIDLETEYPQLVKPPAPAITVTDDESSVDESADDESTCSNHRALYDPAMCYGGKVGGGDEDDDDDDIVGGGDGDGDGDDDGDTSQAKQARKDDVIPKSEIKKKESPLELVCTFGDGQQFKSKSVYSPSKSMSVSRGVDNKRKSRLSQNNSSIITPIPNSSSRRPRSKSMTQEALSEKTAAIRTMMQEVKNSYNESPSIQYATDPNNNKLYTAMGSNMNTNTSSNIILEPGQEAPTQSTSNTSTGFADDYMSGFCETFIKRTTQITTMSAAKTNNKKGIDVDDYFGSNTTNKPLTHQERMDLNQKKALEQLKKVGDTEIGKIKKTIQVEKKKIIRNKIAPKPMDNSFIHNTHSMVYLEHLENCNVYVGGLHPEVDQAMLRKFFQHCGDIKQIRLDWRKKGFGFIHYSTHEQAREAIEVMDGRIIMGQPIKCRWAENKNKERERMERLQEERNKELARANGVVVPEDPNEELNKYVEIAPDIDSINTNHPQQLYHRRPGVENNGNNNNNNGNNERSKTSIGFLSRGMGGRKNNKNNKKRVSPNDNQENDETEPQRKRKRFNIPKLAPRYVIGKSVTIYGGYGKYKSRIIALSEDKIKLAFKITKKGELREKWFFKTDGKLHFEKRKE